MLNVVRKEIRLDENRTIIAETGKIARQADGSVMIKMGNTMLLATAVSAKEVKENTDFMPLSVEYKEKFAATGRFPGGFMKRESKPSDYEILIARLVDRALRPLFPDDYHAETFVTINLISADKDIIPDALAALAASAALSISDIPFHGPISEVRVGRIEEKFVINPTFSELPKSDMDMIVAGSMKDIIMVEGEMNEISETDMISAIKFAHEAIKNQCRAQIELAKEIGKPKREYCHELDDEELEKKIWDETYNKVVAVGKSQITAKGERIAAFDKIKEDFVATLGEEIEDDIKVMITRYFHEIQKKAVRSLILNESIRLDGRKTDEIREIWCEIDFLPAAHGSALFTRGETQSLTTVTLGTKLDEKVVDEVLLQGTEKFVLHYNFPPFATNDARPPRGLSRREIGHGNLAHRALKKMFPPESENPYAIRIVSDILESNGSSSMATVCAGTLALMDAGVKLKKPVSGIAMGLITDPESGKYAILSDILGDEDHLGDMDFKVTGTRDGITATQMDIKTEGLPYDILAEALEQARIGRLHILDKITETISEPRPDLKPHAPRIVQIPIPKDMIGAVIGPGGKIVQEIQQKSGTTIVISEVEDKGLVDVFAADKESIDKAVIMIKQIIAVPEVGTVYQGKVTSIQPFGAFVEILPGKEGLLHISEIDWRRLEKVEEVLKLGDIVEVKLIEIDKKAGKLRLSRKALLPRPQKKENP